MISAAEFEKWLQVFNITSGGGGGTTSAQIQKQAFTYAVDSGAANAYVASFTPALGVLTAGMRVDVKLANNNTGASTLNTGTGPKAIVDASNSATVSGMLLGGMIASFEYNGTNWQILNPVIAGGGGITAAQVQQSAFNYGVDTGVSGTAYVTTLTPAITVLTDGLIVILSPLNTNTIGFPTLDVGTGAKQIRGTSPFDSLIAIGDIAAGVSAILQYNAIDTAFILLNPQSSLSSSQSVPFGSFDVIGSDTGSLNAIAGDMPAYPNNSSYGAGTRVFQFIGANNTGASTYQLGGGSALPIVLGDGSALVGNELQANQYALMVLNNAASAWQLLNPFSTGGGGGITPAQLQANTYTFATANSGSSNAYTAGMTPALGALADGVKITINAQFTNDNSVVGTFATLNVDGSGDKTIFIHGLDGNPYPAYAGAMQGSGNYDMAYSSAVNGWIVQNPSSNVTGEALVNQSWVYSDDTGTLNNPVITIPLLLSLPFTGTPANGTLVKFKAAFSNTGSAVLTVNGIGSSIFNNDGSGSNIAANAYLQNSIVTVQFDTTFNGWLLINPASSGGVVTATQVQQGAFNVGIDSGAADAYIVATTPPISAYTDGLIVIFNPVNTNNGGSTLNAGGGVVTIVKADVPGSLANLTANDMENNVNAICMYLEVFNLWLLVNPAVVPVTTGAGADSVRGGAGATAGGDSSLAIGNNATASGSNSLAIGADANASGDNSLAVGFNTTASGISSFAFGTATNASADFAIAIGDGSQAPAINSTAIGQNANAAGVQSFAIGKGAHAFNQGSWVLIDSTVAGNSDTGNDQWVSTFTGGYYFYVGSTLAFSIDTSTGYLFTTGIKGVTDDSLAPAGIVGEIISSQVLFASAINVTSSGVSQNLTSIDLDAGDYDIWGNIFFSLTASGVAPSFAAGISTTTDTLPDLSLVSALTPGGVVDNIGMCAPSMPLELLTPTTIYMVADATFAGGLCSISGGLWARRRR